jgi:uncharacterized protein YcnI
MITINRARKAGVALAAAFGLALVPALTAYAHVAVSSPDAVPGGEAAKLEFRVPNESDSANTTKFAVQLPTDTPFRFVMAQAMPGWTADVVTTPLPQPVESDGFTLTEAVSSVTWTADGDGIPPDQFAEFALSVGPVPDGVDQLEFPATQTYSDDEVVQWNEPIVEGQDEPENPVPTLALTGAAEGADAGESEDSGSSDNVARTLAIVGVALGATALVFSLSARQARRREAS